MTSVKEFRVDSEPTPDGPGKGRFVFTDDYSVFDWGKMPDEIPGKGASLCTMGAYNFELLETNHVPTHYRGVLEDGELRELDELVEPPREMAIDLVEVPDLSYDPEAGYDYEGFFAAAGDAYLIPLEIVFRNVVPEGSSLRDRRDPVEFGLEGGDWPDSAVELPDPLVEFSTKFEEQDRYLDREEAARVAGDAALDRLEELALAVNHVLNREAERAGMVHEDGKIECLYHDGTIRVADVVGTFDENRFSYDGQEVSKEVLRQWYKREHPEWVEAVGSAKAAVEGRERADWRPLCEVDPKPLPESVLETATDMYRAGTNAYTGTGWFDAPDIDAAVDAVGDL